MNMSSWLCRCRCRAVKGVAGARMLVYQRNYGLMTVRPPSLHRDIITRTLCVRSVSDGAVAAVAVARVSAISPQPDRSIDPIARARVRPSDNCLLGSADTGALRSGYLSSTTDENTRMHLIGSHHRTSFGNPPLWRSSAAAHAVR